jgi:hypothetical protein
MPETGVPLISPGREIQYIPIDADAVPYEFQIKLIDRTYSMTVRWNELASFYTLDLYANNGELLSFGDPVRYGRPCFGNVEDERYPLPLIIPYALDGGETEVTKENFGKTVRLYLFDRESMLESARRLLSTGGYGSPDAERIIPIIPPMPPLSGGVDDEFPPYYHLHMIESIVDLPLRLAMLGHGPIPLDEVARILGDI